MALVENLKIGNNVYTVRDPSTYQSLNDTQAAHLDSSLNPTADGTYNGNEVPNNTVFVRDNGDVQKYSYTSQTGGYTGSYTFIRPTNAGIWFQGNLYVGSQGGDDAWGVWKSTDKGQTFSRVQTSKIKDFMANSNRIFAYEYNTSSIFVSDDGSENSWAVYDTSLFGKENAAYANHTTLGDVLIVYTKKGMNFGWSGYLYSDDDGDSWNFVDYSTILQDNDEEVHNLLSVGNKLFLYTYRGDASDQFDYVYVGTLGENGITWGSRQATSIGKTATNVKGHLQAAGNKIFFFKSYSDVAWYTVDGYTFTSFSAPNDYWIPTILYTPLTGGYVGIYENVSYYITSSDGTSFDTTGTNLPDNVNSSSVKVAGGDFVFVKTDLGWYRISTSMTYDRKLTTINGVLTGSSAPTSSTVGYIGQLFVTTGGAVYICTGVSGSTYTWVQITVS